MKWVARGALRVKAALAATAAIALAGGAAAQGASAKPTRLVVPFPPGAGTDVVARAVAAKMAESLGPIIVENRTGAGGALGTESVARAEPDGFTVLFVASPFTTVAASSAKPTYDPVGQFGAVSLIATGPLVFVCSPDLAARSMRELIALARAKPGLLNYASAGSGGVNHLALELLRVRTGVDIVHIPYRGIGPALVDLLGGSVQTLTATIPAVVPHIRQGKLRALAVTGARRAAQLPNVPTMAEEGVARFEVLNYWGIVAPNATPPARVQRIHAAVVQAFQAADLRERLANEGVDLRIEGPERFGAFLAADLSAWQALVAKAGVRVEY